MATVNPSITYATNSTLQNLFTITQTNGVTSYGTVGEASVITYADIPVTVGANIELNAGLGEWTLFGNANTVYTLTASVTTNQVDPAATYGWYDTTSGNVVGSIATVNTPLSVSYKKPTGNAVVVALTVVNSNGASFQYPAQVVNASATVTEASGYEA
jgi:hypothetical protein